MKANHLLLSFALCFALGLNAQESAKEAMLKKKKAYNDRTMVQRFEKTMIPTAKERTLLRKENNKKREALLALIDTSTVIKDKLRLKLKDDVFNDPFSSRLKKFLAYYKKDEQGLVIAQNEK